VFYHLFFSYVTRQFISCHDHCIRSRKIVFFNHPKDYFALGEKTVSQAERAWSPSRAEGERDREQAQIPRWGI
jgi:hypothetical protein